MLLFLPTLSTPVQIITPFTSVLSTEKTDLLPTISHILFADVWIVPLLKLLDIGGNIKKHILGPRARMQEKMNMFFQGSNYNLGERYTVSVGIFLSFSEIFEILMSSSSTVGLDKSTFRRLFLFGPLPRRFFLWSSDPHHSVLR